MPSGRFTREPITLSFPPFTPGVAWLVGINVAAYFLLEILKLAPGTAQLSLNLYALLGLTPAAVMHGYVWQLVTFDFVHQGLLALAFNMIMLWMFGAQLDQVWGRRRFFGLYFVSLFGAAILTVGLAYAGALNLRPDMTVIGAAAGLYGIYIAFGTVFAESELMLILPPVSIKAKYMAWILIVITLALSLNQGSAWMAIPQLGGILFGYLYTRMVQRMPARAYAGAYRSSRGSYAPAPPAKRAGVVARWRDSYHRWKRRRAARKFEVYMRKYDRQVFFDEHGNYIEPDAPPRDRDDGEGKSGWVN